jgi:NAD-dependent DNA ligase
LKLNEERTANEEKLFANPRNAAAALSSSRTPER